MVAQGGREDPLEGGPKELTVDEESVTRKGPAPPLVIDDLESLDDACLRQGMGGGLHLAQRIARVPHHLIDLVTRAFGGDEVSTMARARCVPAGTRLNVVITAGHPCDIHRAS